MSSTSRMLLLLMMPCVLVSGRVSAYEVDNFSHRYDPELKDSLSALDRETNRRIDQAIEEANGTRFGNWILSRKPCDRARLFEELKDALDKRPVGALEKWAADSDEVSRTSTDEPHVYSQIVDMYTDVLAIAGIEPSIKVNGKIIGVDKLGHFMAEGWDYYEMVAIQKKPVEQALEYGAQLERETFGRETTGIYTYADLAANYAGYTFWSNVLDGKNPYIECRDGRFVRRPGRKFSWGDYVTDAWDEAINCSAFDARECRNNPMCLKRNLERNLKELSQRLGRKMTCPVEPEKCKALASSMPYAAQLLHPSCRGTARRNSSEDPGNASCRVVRGEVSEQCESAHRQMKRLTQKIPKGPPQGKNSRKRR